MRPLTAPDLEHLLALTLAKVAQLERAATDANLRALAAESDRDVALDKMDHLVAALVRAKHETSQAVCQMRNAAHSLKAAGRPVKAMELEERAAKLSRALEV